jgi:hypothetical protein
MPGMIRYRCGQNEPIEFGGKGGNRTLDPGIMRDMDAIISIYIQILTDALRLFTGR